MTKLYDFKNKGSSRPKQTLLNQDIPIEPTIQPSFNFKRHLKQKQGNIFSDDMNPGNHVTIPRPTIKKLESLEMSLGIAE